MQATQATAKAKVLENLPEYPDFAQEYFQRRLKKNIHPSHCSNIKKK